MMNVSSVETATPVRSFHHDSAINVNVDTDALNDPLTTTHDFWVEGQTDRSTNGVTAGHILIPHRSGLQPHC